MSITLWGLVGISLGTMAHLTYALLIAKWLEKEEGIVGNVVGKVFLNSHTFASEEGCAICSLLVLISYVGIHVYNLPFLAAVLSMSLLEMIACSGMNFIIKNNSIGFSTQNLMFAYVFALLLTLLEIVTPDPNKQIVLFIVATLKIITSMIYINPKEKNIECYEFVRAVSASVIMFALAFMM